MLCFTSKDIPEGKAAGLLGLILGLDLLIFFGLAQIIGYKLSDKSYLFGILVFLIMVGNLYLFTRNKFHRKNFTYFEKERLLRSFWKEELVFYLFISVWLIGMVIFTAIERSWI